VSPGVEVDVVRSDDDEPPFAWGRIRWADASAPTRLLLLGVLARLLSWQADAMPVHHWPPLGRYDAGTDRMVPYPFGDVLVGGRFVVEYDEDGSVSLCVRRDHGMPLGRDRLDVVDATERLLRRCLERALRESLAAELGDTVPDWMRSLTRQDWTDAGRCHKCHGRHAGSCRQ
jgi:hypothetical protein